MYVCCCSAVPEKTWKTALELSHGDIEQACRATGAGMGCGSCRAFLEATPVLPLAEPTARVG